MFENIVACWRVKSHFCIWQLVNGFAFLCWVACFDHCKMALDGQCGYHWKHTTINPQLREPCTQKSLAVADMCNEIGLEMGSLCRSSLERRGNLKEKTMMAFNVYPKRALNSGTVLALRTRFCYYLCIMLFIWFLLPAQMDNNWLPPFLFYRASAASTIHRLAPLVASFRRSLFLYFSHSIWVFGVRSNLTVPAIPQSLFSLCDCSWLRWQASVFFPIFHYGASLTDCGLL